MGTPHFTHLPSCKLKMCLGRFGHSISPLWGTSETWNTHIMNDPDVSKLAGCCSFRSLQHLSSHQNVDRLVTVYTHGDFIVLPDPLGNQPVGIMTSYPTQLRYPDPDLTSTSSNLLRPSARLRISKKYQFYKSYNQEPNSQSPVWEARTLPIGPPQPLV